MTMIRQEETKAGNAHHAAKLLRAFGGSMDGWHYTGQVRDLGSAGGYCCCGHPIRWAFDWQHDDGRTLVTGSTCVETAPGLSPDLLERMAADLEALRAKIRADKAKAKRAAQEEEVRALRERLTQELAPLAFKRTWDTPRGGWEDYGTYSERCELWRFKRALNAAGNLKTPKGQLKRLQKLEAQCNRMIGLPN
jgi:hypothetical protein